MTNNDYNFFKLNRKDSKELLEIMWEFYHSVKYVDTFFKGDKNKVILWFATENPLLGGIKPVEMIVNGRGKKLRKVIKEWTEGNHP